MNRRSFHKLLAGAVGAAPLLAMSEGKLVSAEQATESQPQAVRENWEYTIVDAAPPMTEVSGTAVADIDGDGIVEVVIAGNGALCWYRPTTWHKGTIATGYFNVGVTIGDVDRSGKIQIIVGKADPKSDPSNPVWMIMSYTLNSGAWIESVIDAKCDGVPHDLVLGDVDGDSNLELVANSMYSDKPGLFLYRRDNSGGWKKYVVQRGLSAEGTVLADFDGDGILEIASGPYLFSAPNREVFSDSSWEQWNLAPGFREMCRTIVGDITGDGRPDVVVVESEFPDGRLAWFENKHERGRFVFKRHDIDAPFNFAHSLKPWPVKHGEPFSFFIGEMNEGGWDTPYNWQARLMRFTTPDKGQSWQPALLYRGEGTHEAVVADVNGDGKVEIVGHSAQIKYKGVFIGWVQMFSQRDGFLPFANYTHEFIDREKPVTGIDMIVADLDGDGEKEVLCGQWWYKARDWKRHAIPGIYQVLVAYDIDRDGHDELIVMKAKSGGRGWYDALNTDLYWLKVIDVKQGKWKEYPIGTGDGDWPHGAVVAPLFDGEGLALVCGYHDPSHPPQIFEIPRDPASGLWKKRVLADIPYGEQLLAANLNHDGKIDVMAGPYWVQNLGDGSFKPHLLSKGFEHASRMAVADINGDGRQDVILTVEDLDFKISKANFAAVAWLENTGHPGSEEFTPHIIDRVRSPHSLSVVDLDGDGVPEVIVGEHDPFHAYRSQCRLYVYKRVDIAGTVWRRYVIDDRFEHHDGAKVLQLENGKCAIISHGWVDSKYVHIWQPS